MGNLLSVRREVGEFRKRYKWMAAAVLLAFFGLSIRIVQLQLVKHAKYAAIAHRNITRTVHIPAARGQIRDTHGALLATNRPSYNIFLTPQLIDEESLSRIGELLALTAPELDALRKRVHSVPARRMNHRIEMFSDVSRDQLAAIQTHAGEIRGVDIVSVPLRTYPFSALAAHSIGYLNEVNAEDLKKQPQKLYRAGDLIGRSGLERKFEKTLRGKAGFRRILTDVKVSSKGMHMSRFGERVTAEALPKAGSDMQLNLDMQLMRIIENAFRNHASGAAVAVEVDTGNVRALFAKPAYDLNEMAGHLSSKRMHELTHNPFRPLIDKTVFATYFPGSTFKSITALAALEEGLISPARHFDCTGKFKLGNRIFRCTHQHGEIDLRRAIAGSCNVYFYHIAEQLSLDRLAVYAREFGLAQKTDIELHSESQGFIPTKSWYKKRGKKFRTGFTLNTVIGQGNTRVTLLQLAMVYSAIANGGILYVPHLVSSIGKGAGRKPHRIAPRIRRKLLFSEANLKVIRDGLDGAVNHEDGTAYDARIQNGVRMVGKTGTAQVSRKKASKGQDPLELSYMNRDHAFFAGYAPARNPKLAIVILVEHGGGGGKYAAPIAAEAFHRYFEKKN